MKQPYLFVALYIFSLSHSVIHATVHKVTATNIDRIFAANDIVVLKFCTTWNTMCRDIGPEYEIASNADYPMERIFFGAIDAKVETKLRTQYNVWSYPYITIHKRDQTLTAYRGQPQASGIITFVKRAAFTNLMPVTTSSQIDEFLHLEDVTVLGFFEEDKKEYRNYFEIAKRLQSKILIGFSTNATYFKTCYDIDVSPAAVIVFKRFENRMIVYKSDFTMKILAKWILKNTKLLVNFLQPENAFKYLGFKIPGVLLFLDPLNTSVTTLGQTTLQRALPARTHTTQTTTIHQDSTFPASSSSSSTTTFTKTTTPGAIMHEMHETHEAHETHSTQGAYKTHEDGFDFDDLTALLQHKQTQAETGVRVISSSEGHATVQASTHTSTHTSTRSETYATSTHTTTQTTQTQTTHTAQASATFISTHTEQTNNNPTQSNDVRITTTSTIVASHDKTALLGELPNQGCEDGSALPCLAMFHELAPQYKDKLNFIYTDGVYYRPFMKRLGVHSLPSAVILDWSQEKHYLFDTTLPLTPDSLHSFFEDFFSNSLRYFVRSAPPLSPESNNSVFIVPGPVHVVADNFQELVLNNSKHVLVNFHLPWCGYCKAVWPAFEKLAELVSAEDLIIADLDVSTNDMPRDFPSSAWPVQFPHIALFPSQNKYPVSMNENPSLENMIKFLEENIPHLIINTEEESEDENEQSTILAQLLHSRH